MVELIHASGKLKRAAALVLALFLGLGSALAEEEAPLYQENEWNFVDGAMDISGGIPAEASGVLGDIRDAGVLRVATEPYFAPQEFIDPALEGQESYVGPDMELARMIALRMGVALEIVPMEFQDVLPAVAGRKCDLAISALSFTPGRASTYELSKGYYFAESDAGSGIMIRAEDAEIITSLEDLKDRNIMAQSGSVQESLMAEHVPYYREFRRVSTINEMYDALRRGETDAIALDSDTALYYLETPAGADFRLLGGVSFPQDEPYRGDRVAGRKGELELMYFVNGVINELLESGQYLEWLAQAEKRAEELGL